MPIMTTAAASAGARMAVAKKTKKEQRDAPPPQDKGEGRFAEKTRQNSGLGPTTTTTTTTLNDCKNTHPNNKRDAVRSRPTRQQQQPLDGRRTKSASPPPSSTNVTPRTRNRRKRTTKEAWSDDEAAFYYPTTTTDHNHLSSSSSSSSSSSFNRNTQQQPQPQQGEQSPLFHTADDDINNGTTTTFIMDEEGGDVLQRRQHPQQLLHPTATATAATAATTTTTTTGMEETLELQPTHKQQQHHHISALQSFQDVRNLCGRFVNSDPIQYFMTALIILNSVLLGVLTFPQVRDDQVASRILEYADLVILGCFTVEIACHAMNLGLALVRNGWLVFDTVVVVFSWAFTGSSFAVLRSFRIFRIFSLVSRWDSLKTLFEAIGETIPRMASIWASLMIVFYIFCVLFTTLYQDLFAKGYLSEDYFGRLDLTFVTLFQVMTLDNWSEVAREVMKKQPEAFIGFFLFIVFSSFFVINLVVAVICESLIERHREEQEAMMDELESREQMRRQEEQDAAAAEKEPRKLVKKSFLGSSVRGKRRKNSFDSNDSWSLSMGGGGGKGSLGQEGIEDALAVLLKHQLDLQVTVNALLTQVQRLQQDQQEFHNAMTRRTRSSVVSASERTVRMSGNARPSMSSMPSGFQLSSIVVDDRALHMEEEEEQYHQHQEEEAEEQQQEDEELNQEDSMASLTLEEIQETMPDRRKSSGQPGSSSTSTTKSRKSSKSRSSKGSSTTTTTTTKASEASEGPSSSSSSSKKSRRKKRRSTEQHE